jgi:hypothetical protein
LHSFSALFRLQLRQNQSGQDVHQVGGLASYSSQSAVFFDDDGEFVGIWTTRIDGQPLAVVLSADFTRQTLALYSHQQMEQPLVQQSRASTTFS